jgi:hypothetical protein
MYVNMLDTYLCMYFRAKNTPFPPEKVSLKKILSRSVQFQSRYNLKSHEMSEMRTRHTSSGMVHMCTRFPNNKEIHQNLPGSRGYLHVVVDITTHHSAT